MLTRLACVCGLGLAVLLPAGRAVGDEPAPAAAAGVIVLGAGNPMVLSTDDIAKLPAVQVSVSFATDHGQRNSAFEGPLLWTVLDTTHAVDTGKPRGFVRQTVLVTGRDGYTAILAMGEIAPEFEAKQVILADKMDGQDLGGDHLRIVVPGDKRGGRSVHDLASIAVIAPLAEKP
jgi:hypothetical protein